MDEFNRENSVFKRKRSRSRVVNIPCYSVKYKLVPIHGLFDLLLEGRKWSHCSKFPCKVACNTDPIYGQGDETCWKVSSHGNKWDCCVQIFYCKLITHIVKLGQPGKGLAGLCNLVSFNIFQLELFLSGHTMEDAQKLYFNIFLGLRKYLGDLEYSISRKAWMWVIKPLLSYEQVYLAIGFHLLSNFWR